MQAVHSATPGSSGCQPRSNLLPPVVPCSVAPRHPMPPPPPPNGAPVPMSPVNLPPGGFPLAGTLPRLLPGFKLDGYAGVASNRAAAAAAAAGMLGQVPVSMSQAAAAAAAAAAGMMAMARIPLPGMHHPAMHASPGATPGLPFPPGAPQTSAHGTPPDPRATTLHIHNMQQQFNINNLNNINNMNNINNISNMNAVNNHHHHHHQQQHHQHQHSHSQQQHNSHRQEHPHIPMLTFMFSHEDLDTVLYGYAKNKMNEHLPGHALSGLRISDLSYGIDKILGGGSPKMSHLHKSHTLNQVDPSTLDIPEGLELHQTTFAGTIHYGVFVKKTVIPKGTRFGPFRGRQVNTSEIKTNDDNSFMWEVFAKGQLSHFVDGRGSAGNWMAYVNCARYAQEQNLLALQCEDLIYYEACKDIPQGTELLVWYGDCYLQFLGIPVALKDNNDAINDIEPSNGDGYACERCGKVFAYKYYRDKHLKYTRCVDQGDRKFPCHLCTRSFEKRDRLRIHILHVHEKHRPHKCLVCGKSFSQSSSLNKHMRVHSGERPYKCVYCSKAFTASSILRTHIRQHSGEKPFKCKHCGKAFASHAAHDSHVRRTHTRDRPLSCDVCGKIFNQPMELRMHMKQHNDYMFGDSNDSLVRESPTSTTSGVDAIDSSFFDEQVDVVGLENAESTRVT